MSGPAVGSTPYLAHQRAEQAPDDQFNSRLLRLMDKYEIHSWELAARSGIDVSFVSRILSGDRFPRYDKLVAIANAIPMTKGEKQWLFVTMHYIIPEWEEVLNAHAYADMPDGIPEWDVEAVPQ